MENEGDEELDGDGRSGVARPWRLSFVTQITEHLAGTFRRYPLDGQTPWRMTNSYGNVGRTYNLGISSEKLAYSCLFPGPHKLEANLNVNALKRRM